MRLVKDIGLGRYPYFFYSTLRNNVSEHLLFNFGHSKADLRIRLNTLTIDGVPKSFPRDINVLVEKLTHRIEDLDKSANRMLFFDKELADKFSAQAKQYSKLLVVCKPGKTTPGDIYQYIQDNCPDIMKDFTDSDRHTSIKLDKQI